MNDRQQAIVEAIRRNRNISNSELSKRFGIHTTNISHLRRRHDLPRFEKTRYVVHLPRPSILFLERMAKASGITEGEYLNAIIVDAIHDEKG